MAHLEHRRSPSGLLAQEQVLADGRQPGTSEQLEQLYRQEAQRLHYFVLGVLRDPQAAADVVQVAFARLMEQRALRPEARKSWLYRVAYREALDLLRRRNRQGRMHLRKAMTPGPDAPEVETPLVRQELVQQVQAALEKLPEPQRRVVQMRIYQGKTFAAIARELNEPLGTVLGRMHAAVKKLRRSLQDWNPYE